MHMDYLSVDPMQKLYMEVRRAVRQLYVKPNAPGSSGKEWHRALEGGLRREPASQDSLPGPCGGQSLHLHPKQADAHTLQPHLPKASKHRSIPIRTYPSCYVVVVQSKV